ncbi:MAG: glycosyltransferase family 1 protein [Acidimicrobiia bacterium]|nr:glycosyltransferase family 1 protein [Acidimicrobiia bacterium]
MSTKLRIIVSGLIAQYPLGGVAWDYGQYLSGLAALGHDVYYLEDTGHWPYNPQEGGISKTADYNVRYLADVMRELSLPDRWAYRFPHGPRWYGLDERTREEVIRSADIIINVSGTLERPHEYTGNAVLVYIDTDPVFTQIKLKRGQQDFANLIDLHDVLFSFGETIAARSELDTGHEWLATRQPIVLDAWDTGHESVRPEFTTVMNWSSYKPVEFDGKIYGQKDDEFRKFLDLAGLVSSPLEVAMAAGNKAGAPVELLRHRRWNVVDPNAVCSDLASYRTYLERSRAEFSVAKGGYVTGNAGWFSCRSACYLAAGRPAVVQDTGFADVLPVGLGLIAFRDLDQAVAGIEAVESAYDSHSRAARDIAREYFDSANVLTRLIERLAQKRSRS